MTGRDVPTTTEGTEGVLLHPSLSSPPCGRVAAAAGGTAARRGPPDARGGAGYMLGEEHVMLQLPPQCVVLTVAAADGRACTRPRPIPHDPRMHLMDFQ
jgi:hypothetical protein